MSLFNLLPKCTVFCRTYPGEPVTLWYLFIVQEDGYSIHTDNLGKFGNTSIIKAET